LQPSAAWGHISCSSVDTSCECHVRDRPHVRARRAAQRTAPRAIGVLVLKRRSACVDVLIEGPRFDPARHSCSTARASTGLDVQMLDRTRFGPGSTFCSTPSRFDPARRSHVRRHALRAGLDVLLDPRA